MNKKIISVIIFFAVIGLTAFLYITRAPSAPSEDTQDVSDSQPVVSGEKVYKISQDRSKIRFEIGEILRDSPFIAIGTTGHITGDISVLAGLISVGTVSINAKTFKTDNTNRDGAISRLILKSEDSKNEYITFKPTSIIDAPTSIEEGKTYDMTITGDLTISGITKAETFSISVRTQGDELFGTVDGTLNRSDYGLKIPSVPFVASVEDSFKIRADIVAEMVK